MSDEGSRQPHLQLVHCADMRTKQRTPELPAKAERPTKVRITVVVHEDDQALLDFIDEEVLRRKRIDRRFDRSQLVLELARLGRAHYKPH